MLRVRTSPIGIDTGGEFGSFSNATAAKLNIDRFPKIGITTNTIGKLSAGEITQTFVMFLA